MPGTLGALRLIEVATASLCEALGESAGLLGKTLSAQPGMGTPVTDAADALIKQLHLRQVAWGPAVDPISLQQLVALTHGLPNHVAVDVSALQVATVFSAALGRVVLNVLLLAADSLPQGGRVTLAGAPSDLFIRIAGPAAAWPAGMGLCLANEAEAQAALADGQTLQMAVMALLARVSGIRLSAMFPSATSAEPAILRLGG
jgi:hypothetical protein